MFVPGANFSAGDGHAVQGDGEVCLTALETCLTGTFELVVHKKKLDMPRAVTPTHYITMGLDPDLDDAAKQALRDMIRWLVEMKGWSSEEAYVFCSLACDLRVTQLVDGNKGIHAMVDREAGAITERLKTCGRLRMQTYDGVVIGAGHNGLTLAAYLARAGMKIAVLERNARIGGGCIDRGAGAARLPLQSAFQLLHGVPPFAADPRPGAAIASASPISSRRCSRARRSATAPAWSSTRTWTRPALRSRASPSATPRRFASCTTLYSREHAPAVHVARVQRAAADRRS